MDVVFKEVVEFIGEGVNGAVDCFWDAVAEGEGEEGFVAGWEGDILKFSEAVCYLEYLSAGHVARIEDLERGRTCSPESLYNRRLAQDTSDSFQNQPDDITHIVRFKQVTGIGCP